MKQFALGILLFLIISSCSSLTEQKQPMEENKVTVEMTDTLIGKKELSGNTRAIGYFTIIKNDSSDFVPIFRRSKNNDNVWINLQMPYPKGNKTYAESLAELKLILPVAAVDNDFDSLKTISFGRLAESGDLAIQVTKEYLQKFGDKEMIPTSEYSSISTFLLEESTLGRDLNKLLQPYSKSISRIAIEKAHFESKQELYRYSKITTDTKEIPDQILDFMVWISLE